MPPELDHRIRIEAHRGRLARRTGDLTRAELDRGDVRLLLASDAGALEADRIVLATGFLRENRPASGSRIRYRRTSVIFR
jgi:hypothetical protein